MSSVHEQTNRGGLLLAELEDTAAHILETTADLDADTARELARAIAKELANTWGGHNVYVPKGLYDTSERDAQIYRDFTGANIHQLADRYDLTVQRVYSILKLERARQVRRNQFSLPLGD